MTEAAANPHVTHALKIKALELAHAAGDAPDVVVKRAAVYHGYLTSTAAAPAATAPKPGAPTAGPKPATTAPKPGAPAAAGPKAGAATAPKPGAAAGPKAGAATAPKPGAPAANKKPDPNKPPAQGAQGAANADGLAMEDVSKALQKVLAFGPDRSASKALAYKILKETGQAASVRDVKPALYKAVIAACDKAVTAAPPAAEPSDADFETDLTPPTVPISEDDNAVDTDPPEHTSGGADAEDL